MNHKCSLSMNDYEGVYVELERAQEALQGALLILNRRRVRKDELYVMNPIMNSLADALWKIFMADCGRNDGPRRSKSLPNVSAPPGMAAMDKSAASK